jgi:hypothetical protein
LFADIAEVFLEIRVLYDKQREAEGDRRLGGWHASDYRERYVIGRKKSMKNRVSEACGSVPSSAVLTDEPLDVFQPSSCLSGVSKCSVVMASARKRLRRVPII